MAVRTVESLLNIPIHYYVKINYEGLHNLVDALGGVHIDVKEDMRYTDRAGGLYIDIEAGPKVLNGAKAEEFCVFAIGLLAIWVGSNANSSLSGR